SRWLDLNWAHQYARFNKAKYKYCRSCMPYTEQTEFLQKSAVVFIFIRFCYELCLGACTTI
ncbi:hypothetical protein, partial [Pseudomonas veronii]|uniref:hypothetical protein n=1 Tax=Pseudomonas veronii TaxID=76761 RepID=UPI001E5B711F